MRIVFAGTPEAAVPSLTAVADAGHDVVGVITREDAPVGRKRVLTPSPVAVEAQRLGIPLRKANRLGADETRWVRELEPELGVVVAYGGLLREAMLAAPREGWINLHFSDLPRWRGAAPVQRALQAGEQRLGVSVFRLVKELDAGDVLARDAREFPPGTSAGEALEALAEFGTGALLSAVAGLERGSAEAEPQVGDATYAHKLVREDGRLDLAAEADAVLAHWAGVTPEPGAFAFVDGQPVKLRELKPAGTAAAGEPGIVELAGKRALLHLRGGALELVRVQPAGKAIMDGAAWLRGRGGRAVLS